MAWLQFGSVFPLSFFLSLSSSISSSFIVVVPRFHLPFIPPFSGSGSPSWDFNCYIVGKRGISRLPQRFWKKRNYRDSVGSCSRFLGNWYWLGPSHGRDTLEYPRPLAVSPSPELELVGNKGGPSSSSGENHSFGGVGVPEGVGDACATTQTDLFKLRNLYNIPEEVLLVVPGKGDVPSRPLWGYVTMHLESFRLGARLPLQHYFAKILGGMYLAPGQLHPNGWRVLSVMYVLWERCGSEELSLVEVKHLYQLRSRPREAGWYYFMSSSVKRKSITGFPFSCKNWKNKFFFAGGKSWGLIGGLEDRPLLQVETALCDDKKAWSGSEQLQQPSSASEESQCWPFKASVPALPPPPPRKSVGEKTNDKSSEVSTRSGDRSSPLPSRDQGDYLTLYQRDYGKSVGPKMVQDIESMNLNELAGSVQRVSFKLATIVSCYKNRITRQEKKLQAENQDLKKRVESADRSKEKLAKLNRQITELEKKVAVAESTSSKLEGELGNLKSDLQATQSERDTLRTALKEDIKSLSEQLAEEKGKSADVDDQLDVEYNSGVAFSYKCIMSVLKEEYPELDMSKLGAGVERYMAEAG
ncbi:uncharacterized protein LOC127898862 [Citrus sinensis]|uniref:uncharacterized protein LOC112097941 n=1 Tax=Citrus clementina TaxID=85681 RepID=UPI000CED1E84|nr:uncharacterized protein LOC112097941 [Citrus x clementina]XP_052287316.1 uncharacterized protein LOC127898862 [Citrus sinensis]